MRTFTPAFPVRVLALLCVLLSLFAALLPHWAAADEQEAREWDCVDGQDGDGNPTTTCGYGYWRTLCGWSGGVEDCHTFFEIVPQWNHSQSSNVLFLPGIKGSRLYRPNPACDAEPPPIYLVSLEEDEAPDCDDKLWEPFGNDDVAQLHLQEDGRSAHADVYIRHGDVLASTFGHDFYAAFFSDLDNAEEAGTYGDGWQWESGAYDWRLSLPDIVNNGKGRWGRIFFARETGSPYLEMLLRDLADASPSGRVTIVAHSNGGLVAKALVERLGESEAATLIDKIVFVGVPHLGAPQALGALLFGYGEALPFDSCAEWDATAWLCALLMDRPSARAFGAFSPMAYHLLPSATYLDNTGIAEKQPVVSFDAITNFTKEREQYGTTIDSADELYAFAAARNGERQAPEPDDVAHASVLSESLLAYAADTHDELDTWQPPAGIETFHIIGWGNETISGIEFYEEPDFLGLFGTSTPRYRPQFMFEGDGIVPAVSAADGVGTHKYWIDLRRLNDERIGNDRGHATLFETDATRVLLADILDDGQVEPGLLPPYVSTSTPIATEPIHWLRFFLHSPLTLELYDGTLHLGFDEDGTFDDEIDGATYGEFGEVKYITAPAGRDYTLVMRGQGVGHFSLDIQEVFGDAATTTTIIHVPVTPELVAHMELPREGVIKGRLMLDRDGDGAADEEIVPDPGGVTPYLSPDQPPSRPEPDVDSPGAERGSRRSTKSSSAAVSDAPSAIHPATASTTMLVSSSSAPVLASVVAVPPSASSSVSDELSTVPKAPEPPEAEAWLRAIAAAAAGIGSRASAASTLAGIGALSLLALSLYAAAQLRKKKRQYRKEYRRGGEVAGIPAVHDV